MKPIQERKPKSPKHLYHYTSLGALIGIIQSNKLVFRGTRYDSMNDPTDYIFAANTAIPKVLQELKQISNLTEEEKDYCEMYPYTVSFTENCDDGFMWKHYGSEVSLEICIDAFYPTYKVDEKVKFFFDKCIYTNEEELNDAFIKKWKESIETNNLTEIAQYACVYIKRDAFRREKEWRMYSADYKTATVNGKYFATEMPVDIKVAKVREKDIILYKEFILPSTALTGIIVNDNDPAHFSKVKKHIQLLLQQNKFSLDNITIRQTKNYPLGY